MAEVDASIPLQVQGPQPITLNSIAQMYQMQQQIQMQKQQRQVQNALSQIYSNPANLGPDGMPNAQAMMQIAKISPQTAQSMTAQRANVDEKLALTSQHQQDAALAFQKNVQAQVREPALNAYDEALKQGKTPQQALAIGQKAYSDGLDNLIQSGYVPDSMKAQLSQNFDPNGVRASSISYKDQQELNEKKTADDRADQRLALATSVDQQRLGIEEQHLALDSEREKREASNSAAGGGDDLSPDAVKDAAARYNIDGTLPPMGMGKAGMELRTKILNTAAQMANGKDPSQARIDQLSNKADASALTQLRKQQTSGENFEKTALKNADLAISASEKLDRTQTPAFNKWLQAGRRGTGSTEAANFDAANNSFVEEYAKVMTGSTGGAAATDSARQRAHELLDTSMTMEQYRSNMDILKKEMNNRVQSYKEQAAETEGRIKDTTGSSNSPSGSTKTVHWDDL